MAFCSGCGQKLEDGSRFCPRCGKSVGGGNPTQREQVFEGNIHKCPNCGERLNSFQTVCHSCGHEFRNSATSNAIKEFQNELKRIEAGRKLEKEIDTDNAFSGAFSTNSINTVDQQLANLISNFTVPNTQEDIFEFMILAASNIDPMAYNTGVHGYALTEREGKLLVSNAWDSKYNQVHQKAKMMFPNDSRLLEIENLYYSKIKAIKDTKQKNIKVIILALCLMFVPVMIFGVIGYIPHAIKEHKLEQIVEEIEVDISNGNYDSALIKASKLHMDDDWSDESKEHWDEQREAIIKLIEQKKGEK